MAEKQDTTVISDDMDFRGSIEAEHAVLIEGKISGALTTRGKVQVIVGAEAKADISAREVQVDGLIEGNILRADLVTLAATSRYTGDIRATDLEIQRGARFTGASVMPAQA